MRTPEMEALVESIADRYELPRALHLRLGTRARVTFASGLVPYFDMQAMARICATAIGLFIKVRSTRVILETGECLFGVSVN